MSLYDSQFRVALLLFTVTVAAPGSTSSYFRFGYRLAHAEAYASAVPLGTLTVAAMSTAFSPTSTGGTAAKQYIASIALQYDAIGFSFSSVEGRLKLVRALHEPRTE